jgi:DNA-binding transcriptional MerR regulator
MLRRNILIHGRDPVKSGRADLYGIVTAFAAARRDCAAMPSRTDSVTFTISDLAREFALTTRAIRFYEDQGLLAPRRSGRSRIYGERERVRIKLILRGKRLGLALAEIRELLDLYQTTRGERPQLVKFLQVLGARRAMLKQQQEDIAVVLAEIDSLERQCRKRLRQGANGGAG